MESMQERIDALIKMRKEKPEYKHEWETLKGHLIRLLPAENISVLTLAFQEIERDEAVNKYDHLFHEVLITGRMTDEYSITMDNSVYLPQNTVSAASLTLGKTSISAAELEMIKQYATANNGKTKCKQ